MRRVRLLTAACCAAAACSGWVRAQPVGNLAGNRRAAEFAEQPGDDAAAATGPIAYRRVFVPADRPDQWPAADGRRLPLDRAEFQRLVAAAASRMEISTVGQPRLRRARYVARLSDDRTLVGSAEFDVAAIDAAPRRLSLSPWNLAVVGARWKQADRGAPLLGAWSLPDGWSGYSVLVHQSDQLTLDWQAGPVGDATEELDFALELPPCPAAALELDLRGIL